MDSQAKSRTKMSGKNVKLTKIHRVSRFTAIFTLKFGITWQDELLIDDKKLKILDLPRKITIRLLIKFDFYLFCWFNNGLQIFLYLLAEPFSILFWICSLRGTAPSGSLADCSDIKQDDSQQIIQEMIETQNTLEH